MLSCKKNAGDGHFWKSTRRYESTTEMPNCTHGTVLSSLPPSALQRNFDVSFKPFFAYGDGSRPGLRADPTHCWMWAQTDVWSTCLDGPYGDLGCRLLHPAQLGALRAVLCSSGVVLLCSSLQLQISSAVLNLYRRVKHGQGHVGSMAKDTEDCSYACCLLFLQPLSQHTMYLLVCERVCRFFVLT